MKKRYIKLYFVVIPADGYADTEYDGKKFRTEEEAFRHAAESAKEFAELELGEDDIEENGTPRFESSKSVVARVIGEVTVVVSKGTKKLNVKVIRKRTQ